MAQTVLIVDDEKNIVNIIAFNLKKEGYDVLTAGDGEEAVAIANEKNPDLILLDIMMPNISFSAHLKSLGTSAVIVFPLR